MNEGVNVCCFSWYETCGPHTALMYASRTAQMHLRSLSHLFKLSITALTS